VTTDRVRELVGRELHQRGPTTVTVFCPSCGQPVQAPVRVRQCRRAIGDTLVVTLADPIVDHTCEDE
jgi:hypothetical protein